MPYLVGILIAVIVIFLLYIILVQQQIRSMGRQLQKRLKEHTHQPISLELINRDLSKLAVDINKCLQAEENLRLKDIREEKKFKELIADISHDLRTPLTSIKGYQQLLEKGELTMDQRAKLETAKKHTQELGQLIEHFFEYSYLVNTEPELHLERLNLTNLTTECLAASVTEFENNNLSVQFEEEAPVFVRADKEMVTRILQNLIRNCIKHSAGAVKVALHQEQQAVISFQNPIDPSLEFDVDRIFDRFYTGDRARSHSTGLGLSIVKLLSEKMGGSVNAVREEDVLEIRVTLPAIENPRQKSDGRIS